MSSLTRRDNLITQFIEITRNAKDSVFILNDLTARIQDEIKALNPSTQELNDNQRKILSALGNINLMFTYHSKSLGKSTDDSFRRILKMLAEIPDGVEILERLLK